MNTFGCVHLIFNNSASGTDLRYFDLHKDFFANFWTTCMMFYVRLKLDSVRQMIRETGRAVRGLLCSLASQWSRALREAMVPG
jgi:hypothetical protein